MPEISRLTRPSGTVAFLFTDIEGSTRLWEQQPEAMAAALARHDTILRTAIEDHGGHVFKTVGDGFCAAFSTADLAVEAALIAQFALAAELGNASAPILVRMALHTGAAEDRDGDYFGPPLNRVARLLAAGHGGQVLISAATQELVRDRLPDGAGLRDLGEASLKDLARSEHVFQLVHPLLHSEFPPLRSPDTPGSPNNLPKQLTSFIGREREVGDITTLLERSHLLTLIGAGGSGKTRLSLEVAGLLGDDPDGVWLVELASLSDPAFVPQAVADVLKVREQGGRPIVETLLDWLRPKRLLIVLDNCEHLISACARLAADIMRSCPDIRILASSREPLNVAGEQTYRVPSLAQPDPQGFESLEAVTQYEAVRLFVDRSRALAPSFAVTNQNSNAVAQVCVRLDGIPLAIELAAARVRSLSVEEINTRLNHRFRLLTGGSRASLPRQQTLRGLIDWSYDLLNAQESRLLLRLSVFAGGWTLDAAEAVCGDDGVEDWEVLDVLTSLVDKSLVVFEAAGEQGRYRLLETVRQYACDRLAESAGVSAEDGRALAARAAAWFLALAVEAKRHYSSADQGVWLQRLEVELDNLRAGLAWYESAADGAEGSLRFVSSLGVFWATRAHLAEGRQWCIKALGRVGYGRGDSTWDGSVTLADALQEEGIVAYFQSDYVGSRTLLEDALSRFRRLGLDRGISQALGTLGTLMVNLGDYTASRAMLEESLAIERRLGNIAGIGNSVTELGRLAYNQGDISAARSLFAESVTIRRQAGDVRGTAESLTSLGTAASRLGDYAAARAHLEESLGIARELKDFRSIANALVSLSSVAAKQNDWSTARAFLDESLPIYEKLGNQEGVAFSFECIAGIEFGAGDSVAARRAFRRSLALYRELEDQEGIAAVLQGMAKIELVEARPARAVQMLGAARSVRETLGSTLPADEQDELDTESGSARIALGEDLYEAAWESGLAMNWEQAADFALADEFGSGAPSPSNV